MSEPLPIRPEMGVEPRQPAQWLARALAAGGVSRILSRPQCGAGALGRTLRGVLRAGALGPLSRTLRAAPSPVHRALGKRLAAAIAEADDATALALLSTAACGPDRRAEKIVSRRYRFVWICNPKAASRSLIAALLAADPAAVLVRNRTLEQVHARYPGSEAYFSFAFLRHPLERARSFYADKHALAAREANAYRWFIEPYHGLRLGMNFDEFCRWLVTPSGSDAFADRHWLSQWRQLAAKDGRQPDFLGRYEQLDADWRTIAGRLGLPPTPLPQLNRSDRSLLWQAHCGRESVELVRRRYARDYTLGGYGDDS